MACNCGKSRSRAAAPLNQAQPRGRSAVKVAEDRVLIQYNGPVGSHLVVSPKRRVSTYGLHTRGDIFQVDPVDQAAMPTVFVLVEETHDSDPV